MTNKPWTVERVQTLTAAGIQDLAEVLINCVDDNASVSVVHPLQHDRAIAFWARIAAETRNGQRARDHKAAAAQSN